MGVLSHDYLGLQMKDLYKPDVGTNQIPVGYLEFQIKVSGKAKCVSRARFFTGTLTASSVQFSYIDHQARAALWSVTGRGWIVVPSTMPTKPAISPTSCGGMGS